MPRWPYVARSFAYCFLSNSSTFGASAASLSFLSLWWSNHCYKTELEQWLDHKRDIKESHGLYALSDDSGVAECL